MTSKITLYSISIFTSAIFILSLFMYYSIYLTKRSISLVSSSLYSHQLQSYLASLCTNCMWHIRLPCIASLYSHWLHSAMRGCMWHIRLPCISYIYSHWLHSTMLCEAVHSHIVPPAAIPELLHSPIHSPQTSQIQFSLISKGGINWSVCRV